MDYISSFITRIYVFISGFVPLLSKFGFCQFDKWEKGKKLKILLVGYNGARNTGADVRVVSMVEQFIKFLDRDTIEISILTRHVEKFQGYFDSSIKLIEYKDFFSSDLFRACNTHHMVVLCEGSTLKSNFSNSLTLFFCQAAGIMKKQNKPCIAYGSEAGEMEAFVERIVKKMCDQTYFLARTENSLKKIKALGLKGHLGTDTAWTFDSSSKKRLAHMQLIQSGWDGKKPLLGLALMNPFYWPVRPSVYKWVKAYLSNHWENHSSKWYFFSWSQEKEALYQAYLKGIAEVACASVEQFGFHVVVIGMEAIDAKVCLKFREILDTPIHIFSSTDHDGYEMKEILNKLSILITSRYHARVLSLDANVPAIAISMDERLENFYSEIGQLDKYYFTVDEKELGVKVSAAMKEMWENREIIKKDLESKKYSYYKKFDEMGSFFDQFVKDHFRGIGKKKQPCLTQAIQQECNQ
jgi:polysaccharide pyruvyl transferase WcaK-like protein